jgi:DNA replication protein DnaC
MNNTLQVMRSLRLSGMADRYEAIFTMPSHQRPQTEILIAQLLEAEDLSRKHRRSTLAIKQAKFRYQASMQQLSFTENRNLSKETITSLGDCSFIDRGENIIITGATGCGKAVRRPKLLSLCYWTSSLCARQKSGLLLSP